MTLLGFDRSRWNAEPDFAAFARGGGAFVFCKATDGVGYKDPTFDACRAGTHAAGLVFGGYHFAEWGDPVAEARWYLQVAQPRPGELVAVDDEAAVPPGVDVVAWTRTFCAEVHAAVAAWPFVYENQSWLAGHNWAPVAATDGLWLARYDGVPTGGPTGAFPVLAMKQATSTGSVPGEAGQVDVDYFQGDLAALLRYAVPAAPASVPVPLPEADVQLTDKISFTNPDTGQVYSDNVANWLGWTNYWAQKTLAAVKGENAAIAALSQLVAQGHQDMTKDDILATINAAIQQAVVKVDVNVSQPAQAAPPAASS